MLYSIVEVIRTVLSAIIFSLVSVSEKCWGKYWNVAELSAKPLSWNRDLEMAKEQPALR